MPYYPEHKPIPEDPKREPKAGEKRRKLLRLSLGIVSCLLIGYGGVRLVLYYTELSASRQTRQELLEIHDRESAASEVRASDPPAAQKDPASTAPDPDPLPAAPAAGSETGGEFLPPMSYPDNPGLKMSDRFKKLRQKSEYIVGWIRFDDIEEAVVQKDNTFFLNHDAMGKRNGNGAIFLDSDIFLTTRPYTLFLYGHNMKSGNMFGKLRKYKESAYFYSHMIITFDSLYEEGRYAVFSVMDMNTVPGTGLWYDLWSLNTNRRADREKAIRTLEKRSDVLSALDVQADDQLLVLVTCLDGSTERLIVAARRLREGETEDSLVFRQASMMGSLGK